SVRYSKMTGEPASFTARNDADRFREPPLRDWGKKPMKRILWAKSPVAAVIVAGAAAWQFGVVSPALAQQPLLVAPPPPVVAAPDAPASTAMAAPSMPGPLVANHNPNSFYDPFGYFGQNTV